MAMVFIGCEEDSLSKEKVSLIEPAFRTWSKLLEAYILEHNSIEDCKTIGFKPPGTENLSNSGETEDFLFLCGVEKGENSSSALLFAKSKNQIGNCPYGSTFKIEFDTKKGSFNVSVSPEKTCTLFEKIVTNLNKSLSDIKYEKVEFKEKPKQIWRYRESEDKMDNSKSYFASAISTNEIDFEFPYDGGSSFSLTIRNMKKQNEVLLSVSKGQFSGSSKTCRVKFDDTPVVNYGYSGTSDYSSDLIFFQQPSKFIASLKKAEKLMIECEFYQAGRKIIEFDDVKGLEWER